MLPLVIRDSPGDDGAGVRAGTKTGPRPRFDVETAVAVASELGISSFTLSQVATRLGISSPALYRVVSSRDQLADLAMKRWVDSIELPTAQLPWQEQVLGFAKVLWDAYEAQPEMSLYMMSHPESVRHVFPRLTEVGRNLVAGGFPADPDRVAFALDFVADTVQGAHLGSQYMDVSDVGDGHRDRGDGAAGSDSTQPTGPNRDEGRAVMAEFMDAVEAAPEQDWTYWTWTRRKVEFIIAGLESGL